MVRFTHDLRGFQKDFHVIDGGEEYMTALRVDSLDSLEGMKFDLPILPSAPLTSLTRFTQALGSGDFSIVTVYAPVGETSVDGERGVLFEVSYQTECCGHLNTGYMIFSIDTGRILQSKILMIAEIDGVKVRSSVTYN